MAASGIDAGRAIEVMARRYGSGYVVGGRLALTSAHLLPPEVGAGCKVRWRAADGVHEGEGTVLWLPDAWPGQQRAVDDVAVVRMPAEAEPASPVSLGLLPQSRGAAKLFFELYGWPRWARTVGESSERAGGRYIDGVLYLADISPDGLLVLEPDRAPDPRAADGRSAWEGVSGAGVIVNGLVVAVQRHHQNPERQRSLEAVSLDRFMDDVRLTELLADQGVPTPWPTVALSTPDADADGRNRLFPVAPEPYLAHAYTLLEGSLIGRADELAALDTWAGRAGPAEAPVACVVAIGGMGKSALTWKWFQRTTSVGPAGTPWAGKMWWSFYESGATFERFVVKALAYVAGVDEASVAAKRLGEREVALLRALDRAPFLIVLDGIERAMVAYADPDALTLAESRAEDARPGAGGRIEGPARARSLADPNANAFLRRLALSESSRCLISSRLLPAAFERRAGTPIDGVTTFNLTGLSRPDASRMLTDNGVVRGLEEVLDVLRLVGYHPLVTLVLAADVARHRPAPGDFLRWRASHVDFDPVELDLVQRRSHIVEVALRGLEPREVDAMMVVAAFSSPAPYDSLRGILLGRGTIHDDGELDDLLDVLEQRGIIGWDRRSNRYDMHPIMRGAALRRIRESESDQVELFGSLVAFFEAMPPAPADSWDSLQPVVELYHSTISMGRADDAFTVFLERLHAPLRRLGLVHHVVGLLEQLMPGGASDTSRISDPGRRVWALNELGLALQQGGDPAHAVAYLEESIRVAESSGATVSHVISVANLVHARLACGLVAESERAAVSALERARPLDRPDLVALALQALGAAMSVSGRRLRTDQTGGEGADACFARAIELLQDRSPRGTELPAAYATLAEHRQITGRLEAAAAPLQRARELASARTGDPALDIWLARLALSAVLAGGDVGAAHDGLRDLLMRSREIGHVEEERSISLLLVDCLQRDPDLGSPTPLLEELHEAAEHARLPWLTCEVMLHEARQALLTGDVLRARGLAGRAAELAWPDRGSPFGDRWRLARAEALLEPLGPPVDAPRVAELPDRAELLSSTDLGRTLEPTPPPMPEGQMFRQVAEIIEEVTGIGRADIHGTSRLAADLDVDDLTLVEIVMTVEEVFGVRIPDEDLAGGLFGGAAPAPAGLPPPRSRYMDFAVARGPLSEDSTVADVIALVQRKQAGAPV